MTELLALAARTIWEACSSPTTVTTAATVAVATAFLIIHDRYTGRDWRRYFSRDFLTDVEYGVFYNAGFFALLWYPFYKLLSGVVGSTESGILAPANPVVHLILFVALSDFGLYWKHRLMHAVPSLWRIHAIHHSQSRMTLMTSYRFHAADEICSNVVRFAAGLVVGLPPRTWLVATILLTIYQSIQHADTGWTYGPLDRLLVSPRFHNVHHSVEAEVSRHNFGLFFSLWDHLFGTAVDADRPQRYGVSDLEVPHSFVRQFLFPFRRKRDAASTSEVAPPLASGQ